LAVYYSSCYFALDESKGFVWKEINNIYIACFLIDIMAATPPGPRKRKMEYQVDQNTFDEFAKACSRKGFAPQVVLEQAMRKFSQTGKI